MLARSFQDLLIVRSDRTEQVASEIPTRFLYRSQRLKKVSGVDGDLERSEVISPSILNGRRLRCSSPERRSVRVLREDRVL